MERCEAFSFVSRCTFSSTPKSEYHTLVLDIICFALLCFSKRSSHNHSARLSRASRFILHNVLFQNPYIQYAYLEDRKPPIFHKQKSIVPSPFPFRFRWWRGVFSVSADWRCCSHSVPSAPLLSTFRQARNRRSTDCSTHYLLSLSFVVSSWKCVPDAWSVRTRVEEVAAPYLPSRGLPSHP